MTKSVTSALGAIALAWDDVSIVPENRVRESLPTVSEDAWNYRISRSFTSVGYGYPWWSARGGEH